MSRTARQWTIALVASVILLPCLFDPSMVGPGGFLNYSLIKVPSAHDVWLVGTWKGLSKPYQDGAPRSRVTVFRANGTGGWSDNTKSHMHFDWGTENGVVFIRRAAIDAYVGRNYAYKISAGGNTVQFIGSNSFDQVCPQMRRVR